MPVIFPRRLRGWPFTLLKRWPDDRWWRQFGSSELNRLMEIASKEYPCLKATAARLPQAQALVRVEGARLLPFLDAEVEFENERISENGVFAVLNRKEARRFPESSPYPVLANERDGSAFARNSP